MTHNRIHMKDQVHNNVKDIMAHQRLHHSSKIDVSTWVGILTVALLILSH
ncbi:MAG: hypothetical protein HOM11_16395 [Methylococcales bacterium]|jgi:hypothetical protein|nr:hypothetical protein [Methylococcales bacterium]MBT7445875.1 hypothetical protein [Methylococcales bacterium]